MTAYKRVLHGPSISLLKNTPQHILPVIRSRNLYLHPATHVYEITETAATVNSRQVRRGRDQLVDPFTGENGGCNWLLSFILLKEGLV